MTAVYGAAERAMLASLADQIAVSATTTGVLSDAIADKLRTKLPDLDDLTIGRVLVALTTEAAGLFLSVDDGKAPANLVWQGLAGAGLAMTEPEWRT